MRMLFTVVVTFFACMLPFKVLSLWVVLLPTDFDQYINPEAYFNLLYFARIMYYTNSAINPILYNIMSSKFRFEKSSHINNPGFFFTDFTAITTTDFPKT